MTAQEYIQSKLDELRQTPDLVNPGSGNELVEAIFKLLTTKKFRKYSLTPEYAAFIKNSIKENVDANQPINLTFLGGSYKLWRLDEAPESDWAELFANMYYTRWTAPICAVYKPGVWFDFFMDDLIVPRINNITENDVEAYKNSRQKILDFLKPYQPNNLKMTITGVGSLFSSKDEYDQLLDQSIKKLSRELPTGLPVLTDSQKATIELNAKTTPEQLDDPLWREKIDLIHSAYMNVKGNTGYATPSNKIKVFTQPFPNGTCIAVGTTKDSIAKFWVGVGALKARDGSYRQLVLSPSQLKNAEFSIEPVSIPGLSGKNFSKIRLI